MRRFFPLLFTLSGLLLHEVAVGQSQPDRSSAIESTAASAEGIAFFEKKIRPVLVRECYGCHATENEKNIRGSLVVDSRAGMLKGGDSGPAIVPGDPSQSLLIKAISHTDPELSMPPTKKLDPEVQQDFAEWIRMGAPDPRQATKAPSKEVDIVQGRQHWSFQPLKPVSPPAVKDPTWPRTDVDRFVLAALETKSLTPVSDADPRTLVRRVALDLTGLPPSPEDVEAFVADPSPAAWEKLVDRSLDSPRFGEKWARHWLDVARYAESTGKTVNFNYPHAWRYRDYVIASFNNDKPYDLFIKEQLAGDLMPTENPEIKAERMIATGFLAIGPKTLNERSGLKFELDVVDEQIDVTTQAFLGITAACARCHDHKFDPIPQEDYYALAGIFRSTETCYGTVTFINAQRSSSLLSLPGDANLTVAISKLTDDDRKRIEEQIASVRQSIDNMKDFTQRFLTSGQISLLQARLDAYDSQGNPKLLAMGVRDKPAGGARRPSRSGRFAGAGGFSNDGARTIADSPLFVRGEHDQPGDKPIPRGTLQVLTDEAIPFKSTTSGRLELAGWIANKDNPLTARVMVNRIWLQLFGRGLVPTADDFGSAGQPPTHPELLDHVARQFIDQGWSIKRLIKELVMSRTYQLSATANQHAMEVDPDNTLLWRMTPRRLDAEILRDAILAVSEQLDPTPPVGSAVAQGGEGPVSRPRLGGNMVNSAINDPKNTHRSIYLPIIRDNLPESMALFDAADPTLITSDRQQTTVPSQGLYLLNNAFVLRAADAAADRLRESDSESERIRAAFLRFFGRPPTGNELTSAEKFLASYRQQITQDRIGPRNRDREIWSAFCQALFASAEFQYRK
ncbi:MAG: hypothetical protein RIS70_3188 [Planctomycetota bacterium]